MSLRVPFDVAFAEALDAIKPGWRVDGEEVVGPDGVRLRFANRHPAASDGHVDVEFVLGEGRSLWDCVAGFGESAVDKAQAAAHIWCSTSGGALLELKYSGRGEFADHYRGHESQGFAGWHAISGAIIGYGHGDAPDQLQRWWLAHPLLTRLSGVLGREVSEERAPHGIKILFGGDGVAEVRLNGDVHPAATQMLLDLDWPRIEPAGFVRSYVILLEPEPPR